MTRGLFLNILVQSHLPTYFQISLEFVVTSIGNMINLNVEVTIKLQLATLRPNNVQFVVFGRLVSHVLK